MNCISSYLTYAQTGYFSRTALDYVQQLPSIQPFYNHPVSFEGIKSAIAERKQFPTNRKLLVTILQKQYESVQVSKLVADNIESLQLENTFTITTAHQPNIFTGPLYFIYKILHVAKLAEQLKVEFPENNFVPVYYMGSEDADLEELGHIFHHGEKIEWGTSQTGAVGRMTVDQSLVKLLDNLAGELSVYPYGAEIIRLMKECYLEGATIEQATFQLVNHLFESFGVVVLLPDNALVKAAFVPVMERELLDCFSQDSVQQTVAQFPAEYKIQASGRELNLFYLLNGQRERIELTNGVWTVLNTELKFTKEQILAELNSFPDRFSPNVILRPVLQEWILPNIAFIGGGGEIGYWLQLKKVFEKTAVPYPMLVVRNSFLLIPKEIQQLIAQLQINQADLFKTELELINQLVKNGSLLQLDLTKEQLQLTEFYEKLQSIAGAIDNTLTGHVASLQLQSAKKMAELEKKMLRAEKKKFEAQQRQLHKIKTQLFPNNNLQERMDNLLLYYAKFGKQFLQVVYENSPGLAQQMVVLTEV